MDTNNANGNANEIKLELKARIYCNEKNEVQPTEFAIIRNGETIIPSTTDLLLALQAFLNRLDNWDK